MQLSQVRVFWAPRLLSVMRMAAALLLLQHATAKLFGFPHVAMFDGLRLASLIGVAGIIELVGRRTGGAVLLRLPVPGRRRSGAVERGRAAAVNPGVCPIQMGSFLSCRHPRA